MPRVKRVLVVGAGASGLAAAARILERGRDRFRVRLATLGHHIGGRAASWRDEEGRLIDHGQHVVIGFYREMKGLLRRAGVDVEARLVSNRGRSHLWEPRDGRVHDLRLVRNPLGILYRSFGYPGLSGGEKASVIRFVMGNLGAFLGTQSIDHLDDICFTAFCLDGGLAPSIAQTSAFRMSRTGQLNWPSEISAYSMLKSIRTLGRDYRMSEYGFCDGGMSEVFWEPILTYVGSMGGTVEIMRNLVGLRVQGDRVAAAVFAEPDSGGHDQPDREGRSPFEGAVPVRPGTETADTDFDYLVSTLPAAAFQDLNPGGRELWGIPFFARMRNLRSVRPLALQIWHRERLTRRYLGALGGLPGPLPFVVDNKHIIREYRENPRYGAVLYVVGQETGYEDWTDEQLLNLTFRNFARLPGFERIGPRGLLHYQVIRHHAHQKLYWLTEPGVQRFRPTSRTPLLNLFLAGDWVRNELDFPCMEAAVRSGQEAADLVLEAE